MTRSVRTAVVGMCVVGCGVLLGGSSADANQPARDHRGPTRLHFDVAFSPFSYTDLGPAGPGAPDAIVFHDRLLRDGRQVGDDVGSCTVVEASGLSNCTGVIRLPGGTIAFALVNSPPPRKELAITGGSGRYRAVRGDGTLVEKGSATGTLDLRLLRR
jgi:hypothetical protein